MSLQQFFLVLRARYKLALLTLLGTVAVTLAVSLLIPARYTATTAVMVDIKTPDPIAGVILPAVVMPGYMATQVDIINSDRIAQKVVRTLRLDQNPQAKEQWLEATNGRGTLDVWLAELLQKKLDVNPRARAISSTLPIQTLIRASLRPLPMHSPKPTSTPPSN